jgi:hypothetical protein
MSEHPERWLSELYRASVREEPPRSLDAAILSAARRPSRSWLSRLTTWQAPLAAAAVVVVAVTVVIAVRDDPDYKETVATLESRDAADLSRSNAAPSFGHEQAFDRSASAREQQAEAEPKRATKSVGRSAPEQQPATVAQERVKELAPAAAPAKTEASERDAAASAGVPATPPPAAAVASAPAPSAPLLEKAPDEAPTPAAKSPDQAPPPAAKSLGKLRTAPQPEPERRVQSAAEANQAAPRARQDVATSDASRRLESSVEEPSAPEAWLQTILKLRSDGREAEARESLAAFRKRYPEYPLPAALKNL